MTGKALGLPDRLVGLLAETDKKNGFPEGTMFSIMQQEVGGQAGKFINDPAAYHYEMGADGRRVAKHTGKVSTAFGPFGILESTGAKPGYGVAPLKDKSLEEQVRFAGDYLAARSRQAGGLGGGLAGYGEGAKYAQQVAARVGKQKVPPMAEPMMASAATPLRMPVSAPLASVAAPMEVPQAPVVAPIQEMPAAPVVMADQGPDPWLEFLAQSKARDTPQIAQAEPEIQVPQVAVPDFMAALRGLGGTPKVDFTPFAALKGMV